MKIFNFFEWKSQILVLGVIVLILLTSTIGVVSGRSGQVFTEKDCPACPELGMKFSKAYTMGPEGLRCIYGSPSGYGSCSGATLSIGVYTDAKAAAKGFEFWRNNFGDEKALKLPHKMIDQDYSEYDKHFACVKQFSLDYWADGVFLYRTKYVIWIRIEQNDENDAIKDFRALLKCAKEVVDKKEGVSEDEGPTLEECIEKCREKDPNAMGEITKYGRCLCGCKSGWGYPVGNPEKCVDCNEYCSKRSKDDSNIIGVKETKDLCLCRCKNKNQQFDPFTGRCEKVCPDHSTLVGTECVCDAGYTKVSEKACCPKNVFCYLGQSCKDCVDNCICPTGSVCLPGSDLADSRGCVVEQCNKNEKCEKGEDCLTCKEDCGCQDGMRCHTDDPLADKRGCIKVVCNYDGTCDAGENCRYCPDCGCRSHETCEICDTFSASGEPEWGCIGYLVSQQLNFGII